MFDFSPTGILLGFFAGLWAPVATVTLVAIGAALVLLVIAHRCVAPLMRAVILGLATGLIAFGLLWQGAEGRIRREADARQHAIAMEAERKRVDLAEADTRAIAEQATRDLEAEQANTAHLKELNDALAHDPRRDNACVPRDLSRRLRAL